MKIRQVLYRELPALARINDEVFGNPQPSPTLTVYRSIFKNRVPGTCLVAEEKGKIVGLILGEHKLTFSPNVATIRVLFVRKEWRHKGIATELLKLVLAAMKKAGIKTAGLSVVIDNSGAKKLYEKLGFTLYKLELKKKL